jgi:hypothetical protein
VRLEDDPLLIWQGAVGMAASDEVALAALTCGADGRLPIYTILTDAIHAGGLMEPSSATPVISPLPKASAIS